MKRNQAKWHNKKKFKQIVEFEQIIQRGCGLLLEQVKLIAELEPDEKNMVFKMIDAFLTRKK